MFLYIILISNHLNQRREIAKWYWTMQLGSRMRSPVCRFNSCLGGHSSSHIYIFIFRTLNENVGSVIATYIRGFSAVKYDYKPGIISTW